MNKDISEMECQYKEEDIKAKIKEMYPDMDEKEVYYHCQHLLDVDWLKVCSTEDDSELETCVREQVENLL
ncbi:hypothetical protein IMZ31_23765 (plasmid) [Pontibacillus sp. ALD_SL1]|uniref:hypothetical protein n=1 Tax=Pontibacillus sp. ALD_SL1 TaxID=2777185 RepID=UPI001A97A7A5|nr:hypothetical protein [Pontibacillus sp. ALD_SL1]QST02470.1 hypothetical protein IMZ31_23765 [Pontibacillus sp. ALD_SL1]